MKIRIVKASEPTFWYADKVGEVFEVTGDAYGDYFVNYGGRSFKYIVDTVDCEEINETEAVGMKTRYDLAAEKAREAIEELRLAAYEQGYKDARHDLTAIVPVGKPPKSPQEIRDDIVAQAKRDVARQVQADYLSYHNVKFVVNREKRTVVALIFPDTDLIDQTVTRGIAKCDPSDCFNVHIGKAIALRRALGLEVPSEYYQAPQPTEVRVGDVVTWKHHTLPYKYEVISTKFMDGSLLGYNIDGTRFEAHGGISGATIIDDSRDTVAE